MSPQSVRGWTTEPIEIWASYYRLPRGQALLEEFALRLDIDEVRQAYTGRRGEPAPEWLLRRLQAEALQCGPGFSIQSSTAVRREERRRRHLGRTDEGERLSGVPGALGERTASIIRSRGRRREIWVPYREIRTLLAAHPDLVSSPEDDGQRRQTWPSASQDSRPTIATEAAYYPPALSPSIQSMEDLFARYAPSTSTSLQLEFYRPQYQYIHNVNQQAPSQFNGLNSNAVAYNSYGSRGSLDSNGQYGSAISFQFPRSDFVPQSDSSQHFETGQRVWRYSMGGGLGSFHEDSRSVAENNLSDPNTYIEPPNVEIVGGILDPASNFTAGGGLQQESTPCQLGIYAVATDLSGDSMSSSSVQMDRAGTAHATLTSPVSQRPFSYSRGRPRGRSRR